MVRRFLVLIDHKHENLHSDTSRLKTQKNTTESYICGLASYVFTFLKDYGNDIEVAFVSNFRLKTIETKWYGSEIHDCYRNSKEPIVPSVRSHASVVHQIFGDLTEESTSFSQRSQSFCSVSAQLKILLTTEILESSVLIDVLWFTCGSFATDQMGKSQDLTDIWFYLRSVSKRRNGTIRILYDSETKDPNIVENVSFWNDHLKGELLPLKASDLQFEGEFITFSENVANSLLSKDMISKINVVFLPQVLPEPFKELQHCLCSLHIPFQYPRWSITSSEMNSISLSNVFILKRITSPINPMLFNGTFFVLRGPPKSKCDEFLDRIRNYGEEYLCLHEAVSNLSVPTKRQFLYLKKSLKLDKEVILAFLRVCDHESDTGLSRYVDCQLSLETESRKVTSASVSNRTKIAIEYLLTLESSASPSQTQQVESLTKGELVARSYRKRQSCPKFQNECQAVLMHTGLADDLTVDHILDPPSNSEEHGETPCKHDFSEYLESKIDTLVQKSTRSLLRDFFVDSNHGDFFSSGDCVPPLHLPAQEHGTLFDGCDYGLHTKIRRTTKVISSGEALGSAKSRIGRDSIKSSNRSLPEKLKSFTFTKTQNEALKLSKKCTKRSSGDRSSETPLQDINLEVSTKGVNGGVLQCRGGGLSSFRNVSVDELPKSEKLILLQLLRQDLGESSADHSGADIHLSAL